MAMLPDKDKLVHNFNRCANWEEKYLYIIELGTALPQLPDSLHQPENAISGCQSQVWLSLSQDQYGKVTLQGDSDASIVKGLIAVVFILYQKLTPAEIVSYDVRPWFELLALTQHLTPSRTQGLESMIKAIRQRAGCLT